ncbi:MAG TPA: apolipoprotein N-acyltransferase [Pyrinomonadaceae bacterium]|nr:apolipoprotein N-acyltransferase [Pyrinomonadaceae bacterium]
MQDSVATASRVTGRRFSAFVSSVRTVLPSPTDAGLALSSAVLLILSFPNFDVWPLAWIALMPLFVVAVRSHSWPTFFAGWLFGIVFFYCTCYWLTYSMINFGGFPTAVAYVALLPGAIVIGIFPAFSAFILAKAVRTWGSRAILLGPIVWVAFEWIRLQCTGQLWNAIGYSQAYQPQLIAAARFGGVYAVGFLMVLVNAAIAFVIVQRTRRSFVIAISISTAAGAVLFGTGATNQPLDSTPEVHVVAVQPNVPMTLRKSVTEMRQLTEHHFNVSEQALNNLPQDGKSRIVIWPESPMYFSYGSDGLLRERIAGFAKQHRTFVLLNSQEVAPNDGLYNSAILINEEGRLVSQYDKIRLLPFGEYVPLPRWLPGAGLITAVVGDFTPGTEYRQMQIGPVSTGVFICIESAYPDIARQFTRGGADVLINISNDGYLGPTAVLRQHLANAIFRAVENGRPVLRVTNTGITAFITANGEVRDATGTYRPDVRTWTIGRSPGGPTFYAAAGDLFVWACVVISFLVLIMVTFRRNG